MAILALTNPTYAPAMRVINTITSDNPALITTTFDHDYIDGLVVRIYVPRGYGMEQLNRRKGTITINDATSFFIDIDTRDFDAFSIAGSFPFSFQRAQVVPLGEINTQLTGAVART